jgi:hypothetical protein
VRWARPWAWAARFADDLFAASEARRPGGKRWLGAYVGLAIVLGVVVLLRRPDAVLLPQFRGGDNDFFIEQLRFGFLGALGRLYYGFPYVALRVVAALAAIVPILWVPLAYETMVIAITALTMATFALPGFRHLVRSDWLRVGVCLGSVCLPSRQELPTLTNLGWILAIWVAFLSVMRSPRTSVGVIAWTCGSALAVASTPLALVVAPLWVLRLFAGVWQQRRADVVFAGVQIGTLLAVLAITGTRSAGVLEVGSSQNLSWEPTYLWSAITALGWVAAATINSILLPAGPQFRLEQQYPVAVVAIALGAAAGFMSAARGVARSGRSTIWLATYLFFGSLFVVLAGRPALVLMIRGELFGSYGFGTLGVIGPRHRALPGVAMLLALSALLDGARPGRARGAVAAVACIGLVAAWGPEFRIAPYPNLNWPFWAARLEAALASGVPERLVIPSYPPGFEIVLGPGPAPGAIDVAPAIR